MARQPLNRQQRVQLARVAQCRAQITEAGRHNKPAARVQTPGRTAVGIQHQPIAAADNQQAGRRDETKLIRGQVGASVERHHRGQQAAVAQLSGSGESRASHSAASHIAQTFAAGLWLDGEPARDGHQPAAELSGFEGCRAIARFVVS
jgi:hypothetical protein